MKTNNWNSNKFIAFTTTKEFGNLAYQVGDNYLEVKENRKKLSNLLDLPLENIIFTHQSHSDILKEVTTLDLGKGKDSFISGVDADALYTKDRNLAIGIFHADCVPIFLYHPNGLVMIIHAGFIGTNKHITYKVVNEIIQKENLNPNEFSAYIGPSRKLKSYKLNKEELDLVNLNKLNDFTLIKDNETYFDMALVNIIDLIKAGLKMENITNSHIDTVSDESYFSAYKKTPIGRMVSIIKLI
jgi:YfiH family protein